jgi:hypothetical protein
MARPGKNAEKSEKKRSAETRGAGDGKPAGVNASVRPRIVHPHKGDVGRPGTNEEIFQGSKTKELND